MPKRLLILDDEANIRELYTREFEDEGYAVEAVATIEEADRAITERRPDLLILDIRLGGPDGLSYLRTIMESQRDLPVVICSAYTSYKEDFSSWLAEAYVVKSADLDPLKRKVKELLA
jgi:two-component system OmpR family response regulator